VRMMNIRGRVEGFEGCCCDGVAATRGGSDVLDAIGADSWMLC